MGNPVDLVGLMEGLVDGEVHSVYEASAAPVAAYCSKMAPRC